MIKHKSGVQSRGDGKDYLLKTYGVKSRLKLKDGQLIEFLEYLKNKGE